MIDDCPFLAELVDTEVNHKPKFKDEFYELNEEDRENLTQEQEESYYQDPVAEEDFYEQMRIKKGKHLQVCTNPTCKNIRSAWGGNDSLMKYVEAQK